jgi:hypothetical protein
MRYKSDKIIDDLLSGKITHRDLSEIQREIVEKDYGKNWMNKIGLDSFVKAQR